MALGFETPRSEMSRIEHRENQTVARAGRRRASCGRAPPTTTTTTTTNSNNNNDKDNNNSSNSNRSNNDNTSTSCGREPPSGCMYTLSLTNIVLRI